jgi:hypothetical protein
MWTVIILVTIFLTLYKMSPDIDVTEDDVWVLWYTPLFGKKTVRKYVKLCG